MSKIVEMTKEKNVEQIKIDENLVKDLEQKFDLQMKLVQDSKHQIKLTPIQNEYLTSMVDNYKWDGVEAFLVKTISEIITNKDIIDITEDSIIYNIVGDDVEGLFELIKRYRGGVGKEESFQYVSLINTVSEVMVDVNTDRQELKDLSVELQAAQSGMQPEEFIEKITNAMESEESQTK